MANNFSKKPQATTPQQALDTTTQNQNELIAQISQSIAQEEGITPVMQPSGIAVDNRDIFMSNAEKTKRSLVAGTGDVMEQFIDLTQLAYNYLTPFAAAERAVGLDFSKSLFDWVEENTAGKLQDYGVKYRKDGDKDFQWADLATADFWTTDFARQMPNLLTMMAGGVGLAKGAGTLMTRMASKSIAKKGGRLAADMLKSTSKQAQFGGKGLGKLFTRSEKGLALSNTGQAVSGLAAGAGMNLVDGGIVAGMAYDRAIEEFGNDENGRKLAGEVARNIFIDNSKWMAVDAVSWAFTFGGGSKLLLPKAIQKMNQTKGGFGKRITNVLANAGAGSLAGAGIAGAATFGEEGMAEAVGKGALVGLGAGLLPGGRGVKAAATLAPEGIEEMFQETYQEWIEKKAFNEARGEEEKTPTYWDFYSSDEARRTKAVSLVSGIAGGMVGGYTNLINDIADRSYENDQRIDAITRQMNRSSADTSQEKSDAMRDAVAEAVKYDNQESLKAWINEEAALEGGAIDERLKDELLSLMDNMTSIKNKIGKNISLTESQERALFDETSLMAMREDDFNNQKSIYEENIAELDADIEKINQSNSSAKVKADAIKNIEAQKQIQNDTFATLENNYNLLQEESQNAINEFTAKILAKPKETNVDKAIKAGNIIKSSVNKLSKGIVKTFKELKEGYVAGTQAAQAEQEVDEEGNITETVKPEDESNNKFNTFINESVKNVRNDKDINTDGFTDEELSLAISNALATVGVNNESTMADIDEAKSEKIEKELQKELNKIAEAKTEEPSFFQKVKAKVSETVETVKEKVTPKKEELKQEAPIEEAQVVEEEPTTEEEAKPIKAEVVKKKANQKDLRVINKLEARIAELESLDTLNEAQQAELVISKKSLNNILNRVERSKEETAKAKKIKRDAKADAKRKNEYKTKWYSPLRLLERSKIKKARAKAVKESLDKYQEYIRKNKPSYIYAMRDAKSPEQSIQIASDIATLFGKGTLGSVVGGVIYAKNNPDLYNTVKHEFGHVLWPSIEGLPIKDSLIKLIVEDKKALKKVMETYPENVLYDTTAGPMLIEEAIRNVNVLEQMLAHDITIREDVIALFDKMATGQIYSAEVNSIVNKIKGLQSISISPMENQDVLHEEIFAQMLELEDVTLDNIITKDVKTTQSYKRKTKIILEKIEAIVNKSNDEQDAEILKSLDAEYRSAQAEGINALLDVYKAQADKRKKKTAQEKSSRRILRRKEEGFTGDVNQITESYARINKEINNSVAENKNLYDRLYKEAIDEISNLKNATQEQIAQIVESKAKEFALYDETVLSAFKESLNFEQAIAGKFLGDLTIEGVFADNIITQKLKEADLINEKSERMLMNFEGDTDFDTESNDNRGFQERSSASKFITAFVSFVFSEEGTIKLQSKEQLSDFKGKSPGNLRQQIRRDFAKAMLDGGDVVSFNQFLENVKNSNSPELKVFKEFIDLQYFNAAQSPYGSEQFFTGIIRSIYHEVSSNVVENRDILYYQENDSSFNFAFTMSEMESFYTQTLFNNNQFINSALIDTLNDNSTLYDVVQKLKALNVLNQKVYDLYVDEYAIQNKKSIEINGKTYTIKEGLKLLTKEQLIANVASSVILASRAINQTTLVQMAKENTMTSLLNKTSSLYENFDEVVKVLQDPNRPANEKIKLLAESSVFSYLIENGYTPVLSATSGAEVTKEEGYKFGSSYINMTSEEMFISDVLRYINQENVYQMPIMVFEGKSRRYNVTVPKFKFTEDESTFIEKLASEISEATYSDGKTKVSQLFRKPTGTGSLIDRITNKKVLNQMVEDLKNELKANPYIIQNLISNGVLGPNATTIPTSLLKEMIVNNALNKFSAQKTLVAEHSQREDSTDYVKRSAMAIARRRPIFDELEVIITPDLYYNPNAEIGLQYLTKDEIKDLPNKDDYKIVDDSQSWILPEDKRLADENAGTGNEYGSVLKTVYSGRDGRENGLDGVGDLYLKHNTIVLSDAIVEEAIKSGSLTLAKLRAAMRSRKNHIQNTYSKNVPVLSMSASAVKSDTNNKYVKPVDIRDLRVETSDIVGTFNDVKYNEKEIEALIAENISTDVLNLDKSRPIKQTTLDEFNAQMDELYTKDNIYIGLDGSKFGVQNILESRRNETTSTTPIQLLSNLIQALPQGSRDAGLEVTRRYARAVELNSQDIVDRVNKELKEYIDPEWAGNPLSYLVETGKINLPSVQAKLMEVSSKTIVLGSTKFRSPGGIAFESAPVGIQLGARVKASTLKNTYGLGTEIFENMDDNSIVSEIILPMSMKGNFKRGDIVTATRVPADKLAMTQAFVVKGFLDEDAGQTTMIAPAVSALLGSDKDGDSLFIDGKYKNAKTKSEKAYNDFHNGLINLITSSEMDDVMSKSLEGIENFLVDRENTQKNNTDILSPLFDKQSAQNNVDIKNILGVAIIALRDTNYLSHYNAKMLGSISLEQGTENMFKDSISGSEVDFVSRLVNLILDNAKYQRVFNIGINSVVVQDAIILSRLGFDESTVLDFLNQPEVLRMYKYSNRSYVLRSIDPKHGHYDPAFLSWLEGKHGVDAYNWIEDNYNNVASELQEYYTEVKPFHKTEDFKKGLAKDKLVNRLKGKKSDLYSGVSSNKIKQTNLSIIRMISDIKADISPFSDILNVYNTNPQSLLEILSRLQNYNTSNEMPLGVVLPDELKNDPILLNRIAALEKLQAQYIESNSFSNESIAKIFTAFSKIFRFDKGYKSKKMSNFVENQIMDKALSSVLNTNANEELLQSISKGLEDFKTLLDLDSVFAQVVTIKDGSIFIDTSFVSRESDQNILSAFRDIISEEIKGKTIKTTAGEMSITEALLTYEYNRTNKLGEKSRLRTSDLLISLLDQDFVKSVNDALNKNNITAQSKISREDVMNIAEQNKSSVIQLYQSEINDNKENTIYLKNNIPTIDYNRFTKSVRPIASALFDAVKRENGSIAEFRLSEEKIKALLEDGVDIIPIVINNEMHYIDLKTITTNPEGSIKKKNSLIKEDNTANEAARLIAESKEKNFRNNRPERRKQISDTALSTFNPNITIEEYARAIGVDVALLQNNSVNAEIKKQLNKMKASKGVIDKFLTDIFPNLNTLSKDELMTLATDIANDTDIEQLGKNAMTKEIGIALAQIARDEQIALNPEGYDNANGKDISFLKKWLMSNDVDTNNPDVQAMTRIIEKEYFLYTQEYNKEARPIKELAKKLKSQARKKLGVIEYVRLWATGQLNEVIYQNIYTKRIIDGEEYIVLKSDTTGMNKAEKDFYNEFNRLMSIHTENYNGEIPYQAINKNEAFNKQGIYGLYLSSEGMESHLNSVPVYGFNPLSKRREKKTFLEWKELYANPDVKSSFKGLQDFRKIKSTAIELAKKGFDEDGTQIQFDQSYLRNLVGDSQTSGYVTMKQINMKQFGSKDLESIALQTLRSTIFKHGTKNIGGKFEGFDKLGVLIDGIIEYNEDNPNMKEWVETIYKGYIKEGKTPKGKLGKFGKALDAFVLFTTLKILGPWNIAIPLSNIAIGKYQQIRATGMKQFLKGEARFIKPGNYRKNAAIIRNYVGFDLSMYESFYTMKEKTPFDQIADLIMLPMEQSEKYIQGAAFLSYLSDEEYNNISVDEFGRISFKDESLALSEDKIAQILEDVKKEQGKGYNVTNQRLTGMYATTRLLFQFKKYLPTLVVERFGKERIDRFGRNVIGSNTAAAKIFKEYLQGNLSLADLKSQPEHIKYSLKKFRNGIFLSLAIAALAGWDDEDDWMDKLSRDTRLLYDTEKYKYRLVPSAYWNIKSIIG